MEIKCRSFSCHSDINNTQVILANEARVDLLIDEVLAEKGTDFILNAIGDEAIQKYLARQQAA